jgi:hypothetical protein
MSIGNVVKYNQFESVLFRDGNRQWDKATTGHLMFCLATKDYTPDITHTTTNDLGANIVGGDGVPINVPNPTIDNTTTPGVTYYDSDSANFGSLVTITAKYLLCVYPVTPGTFSSTTSKLLWYLDLNTTSSADVVVSTTSEFIIDPSVHGWLATVAA